MWLARIGRHALVMVAAVLIGAFAAACMIRVAPGFEADAEQLDARLSSESVQAMRAERARNRDILRFYWGYLTSAVHGDLGRSQLLGRPVRELVGERIGTSARLVGLGLIAGWAVAVALAAGVLIVRTTPYDIFATLLASAILCLPAAVLALGFVVLRAPAWLAIALLVFAKVFGYARNLFLQAYRKPHVLTARAKGLGTARVLFCHVLPVTGGQVIALAGVSVSLAVGAAIPIESLLGLPGIGDLAWQAALGRDLRLLVTVTVIVAVVTLAANAASDLLNEALKPRA